jgi:hypothetical protein
MSAEKMVLHTDAEGRLVEHPRLPPHAWLEGIYLIGMLGPTTERPERHPSTAEVAPRLAASGVGAVFGDPIEWQRKTRRPSE